MGDLKLPHEQFAAEFADENQRQRIGGNPTSGWVSCPRVGEEWSRGWTGGSGLHLD